MPDITDSYGSKATHRKEYIGKIKNFYRAIGVAELRIDSGELNVGDKIMVSGKTTGVYEQIIGSLQVDHKAVDTAKKGVSVALKVEKEARVNDKVYKVSEATAETTQ